MGRKDHDDLQALIAWDQRRDQESKEALKEAKPKALPRDLSKKLRGNPADRLRRFSSYGDTN